MDILIVDDDATNLALFGHMLEMVCDHTPVQFCDPAAALAWSAGHEVDLVLVDYMMPAMDGLEFLRRFRALPGKDAIPLVMVTADTQTEVLHRALRLGANDFLTKPVNFAELNARVGNLLALRRAQRQLADRADWLAGEVRRAVSEIAAREHEAILRLSRAAEYRDPETGAHLQRMSCYAHLVAVKLGLAPAECELIRDAAPMHDIGKVGIPDAILLKPGRLDAREMAVMRGHARIGADILEGSASELLRCAAVIALHHHEKFDGGGYPQGLAGTAIPLAGRIVAVADVFDALTSARPYKPAWDLQRAADYLRQGAGSHFDPACVAALLDDWSAVLAIHHRYQEGRVESKTRCAA